jgi:hypothetical protein
MVTGVDANGVLEATQNAIFAEGKQACKPGSVCDASRPDRSRPLLRRPSSCLNLTMYVPDAASYSSVMSRSS